MSTRMTEKQQARIVSLFSSGTSIQVLAETWEITRERAEVIIRDALKAQEKA